MKGKRYTKEEAHTLINEICDLLISTNEAGGNITVRELCHQFTISIPTFYKWLRIYVAISSPDKYNEIRSILYQNNIERNQTHMTNKEKFLFQVYKICSMDELNQKEVKQFCDKYRITIKELGEYYKIYLENYATDNEYNRAKIAHYLRSYEKIIFSILKEESIEEKKRLLMQHKELYSLKAHVFVSKHPTYEMQIKQLTILYQQAISEKQNKFLTILSKRKGK